MKSKFFLTLTAALPAIILTLAMTACQSAAARKADLVYITNRKAIALLPPSAIGEPTESHQLLAGTFGGRDEFTAEAYLTADFEKLDILMMSPSGQTICTIIWDGETVEFSSPFVSASEIKAEYIVADMQFVFYDRTEVGKLLANAKLRFEFKSYANTQTRSIYDGDTLVWSMERSGANICVINHLRNYRYDIVILP